MDPYLTPADRLRADAQGLENQSIRADWAAEDYERAGNYMHACIQYRRSATLLRDAAATLRRAAETEGGGPTCSPGPPTTATAGPPGSPPSRTSTPAT